MRWVSIPDSWGYSRISALNYRSWFAAAPEQPGMSGWAHSNTHSPEHTALPSEREIGFPLICSRCQHTAHTWLQSFLFLPPRDPHQSCPPKNVLPPSLSLLEDYFPIQSSTTERTSTCPVTRPADLLTSILHLLAATHPSHHPFTPLSKHPRHAGNGQGTAEERGGAGTGSVLKLWGCRVVCPFLMVHSF